jgi:carboxylesterase
MVLFLLYMVISFLVVMVLSNVLFFFLSLLEFFLNKNNKNDWVNSSKYLDPISSNGKPSVVLVHGFIGSPFDFKELAVELCGKGFRVVVPKMPGQGSDYFAYFRGKYGERFYMEWLEKILSDEFERTGMKPYLAGFSMGGALSVIMASRKHVERLVLIAPFFCLPVKRASFFVSLAGFFLPVVPKSGKGKINDPEMYRLYIPGSMLVSIPAFRVLRKIAERAEKAVDRTACPLLLVYSKNDRVASHQRIRSVFKGRVGNIIIKEFNRGDHILLKDYQRVDIVDSICRFLLY